MSQIFRDIFWGLPHPLISKLTMVRLSDQPTLLLKML